MPRPGRVDSLNAALKVLNDAMLPDAADVTISFGGFSYQFSAQARFIEVAGYPESLAGNRIRTRRGAIVELIPVGQIVCGSTPEPVERKPKRRRKNRRLKK